jgi:ABC-type spermidine/putrescine transport system permease subunit II
MFCAVLTGFLNMSHINFLRQGLRERTLVNETTALCVCVGGWVVVCVGVCLAISAFELSRDFLGTFTDRYATSVPFLYNFCVIRI